MLKSKNSEQAKMWSVVKASGMSVFAMFTAFITIVLVNYAGLAILEKSPGALNTDGIPLNLGSQFLVLSLAFVAGALGAFFLVWMAPVKPKVHAFVYLLLIALADLLAMIDLWGKVPVWFLLMMLLIVPAQVWVGMIAGLKMRRNEKVREF